MRPVLLALLLTTACTEPTRVHRDGGEDVPDCTAQPTSDACDPASRDNVMFTWAKSVCSLLLQCCLEADRSVVVDQLLGEETVTALMLKEPAFLEEPFACRRAVATVLLSRYQGAYQSLDDGRQRFDRDEARQCLSWFERGAAECAPGLVLLDPTHEPKACSRMFQPRVSTGDRCLTSADCVAPSDGGRSTCETHSATLSDGGLRWAVDGACRALPELGEPCPLPWSECGKGRFCAADQHCRARAAVDDLCLTELCEEAAFCDSAQSPPRCVLRRSSYAACRASSECRTGLECDPALGVCIDGLASVDPLDVEFTFCLGPGDHRVARQLEGVPADGGL